MVIAMIYRPTYIEKIMAYVDTPFVKILSGVRRCGKSSILKMVVEKLRERGIADERILTYNFDSLQYEGMTAKKLYNEIKGKLSPGGKAYLFLDEVQEVNDWEKAVNSFMTDFDVDLYVTGSNSRMLSSEISTYLTGRYIQFRIFPLSFHEYLMFRNKWLEKDPGALDGSAYSLSDSPALAKSVRTSELAQYLRFGGFPAIHLQEYSVDEAYTIVKDIYSSTIFTDIVKRSQIRKIDQLERIIKFAFDNIGRTFSAASISKYLKSEHRTIDNETVYNYLSKLESAFILHRCSRYDIQRKEILKTQEKFYVCDPAMKYSVLGYTSDSVAAMLENIVYLELLRRGYEVAIGQLASGEIDFVATKQENKLYIQIAERIERKETEQREYDRLLGIADNYPKYVLRADEFSGGNYLGIKTMHIADFLLSTEY
jgi:predicted AAA+ superfamily ATPase